MSSDKSSDIVDRSVDGGKKDAKFDSQFKSLSSRSFYTSAAGRSHQKVNRKLDFDVVDDEMPSTARVQLALEASLNLLAASEADNDGSKSKNMKKTQAKSMGLMACSPRSPTLSKLQKRSIAMEAQFSVQGGSPFATPHYAQAQDSSAKGKGTKRSRVVGGDRTHVLGEEEEDDEEGDLQDAIAKRGRGRQVAGNLGTSGLLGSFYGPSSAGV